VEAWNDAREVQLSENVRARPAPLPLAVVVVATAAGLRMPATLVSAALVRVAGVAVPLRAAV